MDKLEVIVLARNEEKNITACLNSLNHQNLKPTKIIIYDDDSTDHTPEIIEKNRQDNYQIIHHKREKNDVSHSYHTALRNASKYLDKNIEYVGILDADTIIEPSYYTKILSTLQNKGVGLAGGLIIGEDMTPRLMGLPYQEYIMGANRVYTKECWIKLNHGMTLGQEYNLSVDTHHYLRAVMLGFKPKMMLNAKSLSLRTRPPAQPYFRGYSSYKLGYYPWYLMLRVLRNISPKMLTGYLTAMIKREPKWKCSKIVKDLQINRVKGLLKLVPKQKEINSKLIESYEGFMIEYGKMLAHSTR